MEENAKNKNMTPNVRPDVRPAPDGMKAARGASKLLFWIWQWTWGLPVNIVGLIMYLALYKTCKHDRIGNAFITLLPWNVGGLSMGMFIFMAGHGAEPWTHDTRIHEYGHTIQCLLLGPLYWFVVGIPSAVWCNFFAGYRKRKHVSYYKLYCESWANRWGEKWTGMKQEAVK